MSHVAIEGGFAQVGAGTWLMSRAQPVAFSSSLRRLRRPGLMVRDRSHLDLVQTSGESVCADADRPFLTHIPCAAPINAVSEKVLVAPCSAWAGAEVLRVIPMSVSGSMQVSSFANKTEVNPDSPAPESFVVMATAGRTKRLVLEDGLTLSVRPDSLVAWTGKRPTGFCPKLGVLDMILPRGPKDLLLNFYGPCIVWVEGSRRRAGRAMRERRIW